MFDADFFLSKRFLDAVNEFSQDHGERGFHGDAALRVEVVTLAGDRLDTMQLIAAETEARLLTRDERLVFVAYEHIAYVDVSVLQDHRIPGFQLSTSSK